MLERSHLSDVVCRQLHLELPGQRPDRVEQS